MARRVKDPDVGEIRLESEPVSEREWEIRKRRILGVIKARRTWPDGKTFECPNCGKRSLEGRSDLSFEVRSGGRLVVYRHLHGARCSSCDAQALEAYDQVGIEAESGMGFRSDYETKVCVIGRGTLGIYWPKDVERVMGLRPNKRLLIEIVDRDTGVFRIRDGEPEESPASGKGRPRRGRRR